MPRVPRKQRANLKIERAPNARTREVAFYREAGKPASLIPAMRKQFSHRVRIVNKSNKIISEVHTHIISPQEIKDMWMSGPSSLDVSETIHDILENGARFWHIMSINSTTGKGMGYFTLHISDKIYDRMHDDAGFRKKIKHIVTQFEHEMRKKRQKMGERAYLQLYDKRRKRMIEELAKNGFRYRMTPFPGHTHENGTFRPLTRKEKIRKIWERITRKR